MALVLDATPGGVASNTYCTLAEGDAYHETRLWTDDWDGADDSTKNIALVMATRLLDEAYDWEEFTTTETQKLKWPRSGILDYRERAFIDNNAIPPELKNAVAEFARQLIAENRAADSDVEAQGLTQLKAGSVSLTFKDYVYRKVLPDAVYDMIPSWWGTLRDGRGTGSAEMLRS